MASTTVGLAPPSVVVVIVPVNTCAAPYHCEQPLRALHLPKLQDSTT